MSNTDFRIILSFFQQRLSANISCPKMLYSQDLETDLLPWLDDMTRSLSSEMSKPQDDPEELRARIAAVKSLMDKVERHRVDVDDVAAFGESALELVNCHDADRLCPSAVQLGKHLQDVQQKLVYRFL